MKFKILVLMLTIMFAPACIAHFPTHDVLIVPERPVVRIVHHSPPPARVVRVHHYHRPVVIQHRHVTQRHRHTVRRTNRTVTRNHRRHHHRRHRR